MIRPVLLGVLAAAFTGCGGEDTDDTDDEPYYPNQPDSPPSTSPLPEPYQPSGSNSNGPVDPSPYGGGSMDERVEYADVRLVGALVGPGKSHGAEWDGLGGQVPDWIWAELASALGAADPVSAIVAFFAGPIAGAVARPDPYGEAILANESHSLPENSDTFEPRWTKVAWSYVQLDGARLTIELLDADSFDADDSIGGADLNEQDLREALVAGQQHWVLVADQQPNPQRPQLIAVGISVQESW